MKLYQKLALKYAADEIVPSPLEEDAEETLEEHLLKQLYNNDVSALVSLKEKEDQQIRQFLKDEESLEVIEYLKKLLDEHQESPKTVRPSKK